MRHEDQNHDLKPRHHHDLRGRLSDFFRPHSHDHADQVDTALETSAQGIRALKVSLIGLGITAVLQTIIVAVSGSVALLSDTIHNFGDALTALPLWVAFVLGRRPRNRRFTHGYGRAEDLAGVFIIVAIAISAVVAGYESINRLIDPQPLRHIPLVFLASLIGFAGNEWVASYRIRVGRAIGSAALVADGMHARTDGLTSLAVFAGALGVAVGFEQADAIAGLLITIAIASILRNAARDVYHRLMDAVAPDVVDRVEEVLREMGRLESVDDIRMRWIGHHLRAEVEVTVDGSLTVVEAHDIAVEAQHRLLHEIARLVTAIIHTNPSSVEGQDHHAPLAHHFSEQRND